MEIQDVILFVTAHPSLNHGVLHVILLLPEEESAFGDGDAQALLGGCLPFDVGHECALQLEQVGFDAVICHD